jgi:hypothetical protein
MDMNIESKDQEKMGKMVEEMVRVVEESKQKGGVKKDFRSFLKQQK